ncbi:TIGR00270 family protein [Candidatus Woesearchaeota archaeon]|nr:TIGR00270 family protein [Candidatus Woesearchaeota archaeon]
MNCDLCGKTTESLAKAIIEGVNLDVCADCAKFGKVISAPKRPSPKEQHMQLQKREEKEKTELIVEDYPEIIKKKRESMGLTQKEFANRINEKEVIISKIETGAFAPPINLARKLEKFLGIKLVEEYKEDAFKSGRKSIEGFTLGDFIKIKK